MRKVAWWASAVISLALICPGAFPKDAVGADEKPKKARQKRDKKPRQPKKGGPRGEYAIMVKLLEMDTDQQAKLMAAIEKQNQAMKDWEASQNGQKYKELMAEAKKARADKDKEKMKSIYEQLKAIRKEREELSAAQKAMVMGILTDEQKAKWAGFSLYRTMMGRFKRCNLTEEQQASLRELCQVAAKDMPDRSDRKAYGQAMRKAYESVEEKILTDAQREELKKKPARKPREPREKKPRNKAAKGKKAGPVIVD